MLFLMIMTVEPVIPANVGTGDGANRESAVTVEPLKIKRFMFEINPNYPFPPDLNFSAKAYATTTDMWNGHYDMLYKAQAIHQIRTDYISTLYRNIQVIWAPGDKNLGIQGSPECNSTEWNLFAKNGWILKDAKGNDVYINKAFQGCLVDIGNSSYQNWLANWYKDYCDTYGIDGAYLDLYLPTTQLVKGAFGNHFYSNPYPLTETVPLNPRTNNPWTDEEYTNALKDLSAKVKNAVGSRLVLANTIFSGNGFYDAYNEQYYKDLILNSAIDGIVFEAPWSETAKIPYWYDEGNWTASLNCLAWLEDKFLSRDKILMLISENAGCNWPLNDSMQVGDPNLPSGVSKEQYVTYCFASTLLSANSSKIYQTFGYYTPYSYPQSLYQIDLGNPQRAYNRVDSKDESGRDTHLYIRQFSKGDVLVNPTNFNCIVGFDANKYNFTGERLTSPVTVYAHTAQILLNTAPPPTPTPTPTPTATPAPTPTPTPSPTPTPTPTSTPSPTPTPTLSPTPTPTATSTPTPTPTPTPTSTPTPTPTPTTTPTSTSTSTPTTTQKPKTPTTPAATTPTPSTSTSSSPSSTPPDSSTPAQTKQPQITSSFPLMYYVIVVAIIATITAVIVAAMTYARRKQRYLTAQNSA